MSVLHASVCVCVFVDVCAIGMAVTACGDLWVPCVLLVGGDVETEEGQQERGDDAGQDEQQQHGHCRVLHPGAQGEVGLVQPQEDLILQGGLHTPGDLGHLLQTLSQDDVGPGRGRGGEGRRAEITGG